MSTTGGAALTKVTPFTVAGPLHQQNRTALSWSWQGPVAFGCQTFVVVVDPRTVQCLQTLVKHKANVIKVCWEKQLYHYTVAAPYTLKLASVDSQCQCIVWDVGTATAVSEFSLGTRPLVDIQWLGTNDSCRDLLAVLVAPSTMTIWNSDTGTKITRFTFTESISAFAFNPFQTEQLMLLSAECFIFVNDFNPLRSPAGGGKKLYLSMPQQNGSRTKEYHRMASGDNKSDDYLSLTDCLQMSFSPSNRHHLFLLYTKEVLVVDTEIMQVVGSIYLERNSSPFLQVFPCWQRDVLYCLHENGCVSVRVHHHIDFPNSPQLKPADFMAKREIMYDLFCYSEPLRISKSCFAFSFDVCPTTELQVAVLTSDGKLMFWGLQFEEEGMYSEGNVREASSCPTAVGALPVGGGRGSDVGQLTLQEAVSPHWFTPPNEQDGYPLLSMNLVLIGVYYSLISNPTSIRMCPPLTTKNFAYYQPLVAVGNNNGMIQVFDLGTRQLYKELSVHTCPVKGIEWVTHNRLLTYAHPTPNSAGQVRNELAITHLDTGDTVQIKKSDAGYQYPIIGVRVSLHKNYFYVNIKDTPPEFYDAKTFSFMRSLDAQPASFTTMEWAVAGAFPSWATKTRSQYSPDSAGADGNEFEASFKHDSRSNVHPPEKEIITLMDNTSNVHHLVVCKSNFELGPHKSVQTMLNLCSTMTWKGDVLVAGDVNGTLMVWEINKESVKHVDTPKSAIKKLKFGPGKGNRRLLLLYANRLEIRDMSEDRMIGQLRWAKDELSVEEVDWCTSDKPVCLMSDGSLRVYDYKLQSCSSSRSCDDYNELLFTPHTMLPQIAFRLKCVLQHQPWNMFYSLDTDEMSSTMDPIQRGLSLSLQSLPMEYRENLLNSSLGTPQRALVTALLFGDEREVKFWCVALYHMLREKQRRQDHRYLAYQFAPLRDQNKSDFIHPNLNASTNIDSIIKHDLEDLLDVDRGDGHEVDFSLQDVKSMLCESNRRTWHQIPPLDLSFDVLCDQDMYKRFQLFRALCHDSRRQKASHTRKCGETMLLIGQTDRAVQLLLETDSTSSEYYSDSLMACLAATIRSSGASQSTIKLVATNLIASSRLMEGSQLLCLIDKGADACRYMQTYGEWSQSVWLAKSTLSERETTEVMSRWADNLSSTNVNKKNMALLVYLSLGQFMKVIESLYSMRYFDQAAVFLESCLEYGLIRRSEDTTALIEAVFLEYARYLDSLNLKRGMRYYCNLAGDKGEKLLNDTFSPSKQKRHT